jgi:hypothetical protein
MNSLLLISIFTLGLTAGCKTVPTVPTPSTTASDATPPLLKLGSAGLKKDLLLNQVSTAAEQRRAKRSDEILLIATAQDPETGIKSVTLDMTLSVICGPTGTNQTFSETQSAPAGTATLPTELSKSYLFKPAVQRAGCGSSPSSVTLSITASAENGVGKRTLLQTAQVSSFGPDTLRVATFNLFAPGNHSDATYQRWGQQLGAKSDVLLLTEVLDPRRAELVANAAGMAHLFKQAGGDVAILSRTPLYNIQTRIIDPPGQLTSNNSNILSAQTDIGGFPHQFIATHWGIRDANDVLFPAHTSSPSRLLAAQAMIGMAPASSKVVFVGGDMNAYSGFGPQDHDGNPTTPDFVGSTTEVDFLRTRFSDPFITLNLANDVHCSNQRIDYVMVSGPYVPVKYEACFEGSGPSDHPFVLITFEPGN